MPGEVLHALLRRRSDAVLSHATAAHLHGLPTPSPAGGVVPPVDVTVPAGASRLRLPGVAARRDAWLLARGCRTLRVNDVDHRDGYRRITRLVGLMA